MHVTIYNKNKYLVKIQESIKKQIKIIYDFIIQSQMPLNFGYIYFHYLFYIYFF